MVRGFYTAATGMMVQRDRMDTLTNNITNADTMGYKQDTVVTSAFTKVMLSRINDPSVSVLGGTQVGGYDYGTRVDKEYTDFSKGNFESTGKSTDLAITGNGFFAVNTAAGERYTKAGNFSVDSGGYLVTEDGNYVLGENGKINVGTSDFTVSKNGTVAVGGRTVDTLRLETFDDLTVLRKQGNNLYYAYGGAAPVAAKDAAVKQGMLEGSNVDVATEMVDMLSLYRKYEASQKMVSMTDNSLELTVNLGKLGG